MSDPVIAPFVTSFAANLCAEIFKRHKDATDKKKQKSVRSFIEHIAQKAFNDIKLPKDLINQQSPMQWVDESLYDALLRYVTDPGDQTYLDLCRTHFEQAGMAGVVPSMEAFLEAFFEEFRKSAATHSVLKDYVIVGELTEQTQVAKEHLDATNRQTTEVVDAISRQTEVIEQLGYSRSSKPQSSANEPESQPKPWPTVLPEPGPLPPGSVMALDRNPFFKGRESQLTDLAKLLDQGREACVTPVATTTGIGGIGKTQLACEFAYRYGRCFQGVFWLDFAEPVAIESQIARCGRDLGIPGFENLEEPDQVQRVLAQWGGGKYLLIFDNCEDQALVRLWRPASGACRVLVTSRIQKWIDPNVQVLGISTLSRPESIKLLSALHPSITQEEADAVADTLGDFPLALHMAGSYLENLQGITTVTGYLNELSEDSPIQHDSLTDGETVYQATQHELDVGRTFLASYRRLDPNGEPKRLLHIIAQMAPGQWVAFDILSIDLEVTKDKVDLRKHLTILVNLGFIERNQENGVLMHRLVVAFVLNRASDEEENDASQGAFNQAAKLLTTFASAKEESQRPRDMAPAIVHLEHAVRNVPGPDWALGDDLHHWLGRYYRLAGKPTQALAHYEQCLKLNEVHREQGDPEIAISQSYLGLVLQDLGRYEEAAELLGKALASDEASYEAGHPKIAIGQSNLGLVLRNLGRYEEAAELLGKALASDEASYEAGHPEIAISQSNLGQVLKDLGRYEEAAELLGKALASAEASYETGHPYISIYQSNLGQVLADLGRYEEAAGLLGKALASDEASYEAGHPKIARSQSNLGMVLKDLGRYEEAAGLLGKALASAEASYEAGHPYISTYQSNLGMVLKGLGRYEETAELLGKALASAEVSYEAGHPEIAIGQSNLGLVLRELGRYEEAAELMGKALASDEASYEAGHPSIAIRQLNLATVYYNQRFLKQSLPLIQQAHQSFLNRFGEKHPHTKNALSWLKIIEEAMTGEP